MKDANKVHVLNGSELNTLFRRANQQNKDATYLVYFQDANVTATIRVTRGRP